MNYLARASIGLHLATINNSDWDDHIIYKIPFNIEEFQFIYTNLKWHVMYPMYFCSTAHNETALCRQHNNITRSSPSQMSYPCASNWHPFSFFKLKVSYFIYSLLCQTVSTIFDWIFNMQQLQLYYIIVPIHSCFVQGKGFGSITCPQVLIVGRRVLSGSWLHLVIISKYCCTKSKLIQ